MLIFEKRIIFCIISFLLLCSKTCFSQKYEVGIGAGIMNYKGEMSPSLNFGFSKPGANIMARYNISKEFSARFGVTTGSISGDDLQINDPINQKRGKSFTTSLFEVSLLAEYNFFNYKYDRRHKDWSPYVFAGIAGMAFNNTKMPYSAHQEYSKGGFVIPYGIGIKYNLKNNWGLNVEFGTRRTYTDEIDNAGKNVPQTTPLSNDVVDTEHSDQYYYSSIALTYTFMSIWCPSK